MTRYAASLTLTPALSRQRERENYSLSPGNGFGVRERSSLTPGNGGEGGG